MVKRLLLEHARDLIGLIGLGLVTVGSAQVYAPAGYLVPGAFCLTMAILWRYR